MEPHPTEQAAPSRNLIILLLTVAIAAGFVAGLMWLAHFLPFPWAQLADLVLMVMFFLTIYRITAGA